MFQISRRADYAVRIMIELGMNDGSFLSATKVARRTAVPKAFLHKITPDRVKQQLIATQSGPSGGLTINRPTTEINLRQILEAVEGPICLNVCLLRPQECKRDAICPAHDFWGRLQIMLIEQLEAVTLAALIAEAKQLADNPERRQQIPYLIKRDDVFLHDFGSGKVDA
jgi:Rrf2 family protein